MPEKPECETVTVEQIALTNMYQFEALLNVLERKGMVTSHLHYWVYCHPLPFLNSDGTTNWGRSGGGR